MRRMNFSLFLLTAALLSPGLALAQAAPTATAPAAAVPASAAMPAGDAVSVAARSHLKPLDPANPYSVRVTALATDLAQSLNDQQAASLSLIKVSFGNMGAVRVAEQSVSRAIDSCDQHNPAMKPALDAKFTGWKQTVGPALAAQDQQLRQTVQSGIAGNPKAIKTYLAALESAATYAAQQQNFPPASTADACKNLMASMGRTKDAMAALLAAQAWPTPDMFKAGLRPAAATPAATPTATLPADLPHSLPPGAQPGAQQ